MPSARAADVQLGERVAIGANAVIESGVVLGDDVRIGPGCFVGKDTRLGARSRLWANVTNADKAFTGFLMKATKGQANPQVAQQLLAQELAKLLD